MFKNYLNFKVLSLILLSGVCFIPQTTYGMQDDNNDFFSQNCKEKSDNNIFSADTLLFLDETPSVLKQEGNETFSIQERSVNPRTHEYPDKNDEQILCNFSQTSDMVEKEYIQNQKLFYFNQSDEKDEKNIPYLKSAVWKEANTFPKQLIYQTEMFIKRENTLREIRKIPSAKNVVQFCFYGFYGDTENTIKIFEERPDDTCEAVFYLSGNKPSDYILNGKNSKEKILNRINTQTLPFEKTNKKKMTTEVCKTVQIVQRDQPAVESIEINLKYLSQLQDYLTGTPTSMNLRFLKNVDWQIQKISQFKKRCITSAESLKNILSNALSNNKNFINTDIDGFTNIPIHESEEPLKNLINAFDSYDFNFESNLLKNERLRKKEEKNLGEEERKKIIEEKIKKAKEKKEEKKKEVKKKVKKKIDHNDKNNSTVIKGKERQSSLTKLPEQGEVNSSNLNLGCSEQLFYHDIGEEFRNNSLAEKVKEDFGQKKGLKEIWLQINTTQTPCEVCLVAGCGHVYQEMGAINSLFKKIKNDLDVPIKLVFSYQKNYSAGYDFLLSKALTEDFLSDPIISLVQVTKDDKTSRN